MQFTVIFDISSWSLCIFTYKEGVTRGKLVSQPLHWLNTTTWSRQMRKSCRCRCESVHDHCDGFWFKKKKKKIHALHPVHTQVIPPQCFNRSGFYFVFWYKSLKQIVYFWRKNLCLFVHCDCIASWDCFSRCRRFFTKAWASRSPFLDSSNLRMLSSGKKKRSGSRGWSDSYMGDAKSIRKTVICGCASGGLTWTTLKGLVLASC